MWFLQRCIETHVMITHSWIVTLSNNDKIFITEPSAIKSAGTEL